MAKLFDLARMTTATTGTGTITLGSAFTGFLSFAGAGVSDGDVIDYAINDPGLNPTASEIGTGTYTAAGTTLTRSVTKSTNSNSAISLSGNAHVFICARAETLNDASLFSTGRLLGSIATREVLSGGRTYFVATTGSDSNNGLTSGSPFLTIQKAIDVCYTLDLNNFSVTIQVAAGTYTAGAVVNDPFVGGVVSLIGDTTTPSNVFLNVASTAAIFVTNGGFLNAGGFKIANSAGHAVLSLSRGFLAITGAMEYSTCAGRHIDCESFSFLSISADYTISGNCGIGHFFLAGSSYIACGGRTITITGTPSLSNFAFVDDFCCLDIYACTFSGSPTCARFVVNRNSFIRTDNAGANYLPGNSAGSTDGTGNYDTLFGKYPISTSAKGDASYTLVIGDIGTEVNFALVTTARTLTIPLNSSVAFPIGTPIWVTASTSGAGGLTITPASGVTYRGNLGGLLSSTQRFGISLLKIGTDTWIGIGG